MGIPGRRDPEGGGALSLSRDRLSVARRENCKFPFAPLARALRRILPRERVGAEVGDGHYLNERSGRSSLPHKSAPTLTAMSLTKYGGPSERSRCSEFSMEV